jgi:hypothetical protein
MVYTTMANREITLFSYVRELIKNYDFRDELGILAMKNTHIIIIIERDLDDANEKHFYDDEFLSSYWVEFFALT